MNRPKQTNFQKLYWLGFLAILLLGCTSYYKPMNMTGPDASGNARLINTYPNKYFILRQGKHSYKLTDIQIDTAAQSLHATLGKVDQVHLTYVKAVPRRYAMGNAAVLNEVHVYSKDTSALATNEGFILPLDRIEKIEFLDKDKGRTTGSYFLGAAIGVVGLVAIIAIVADNEPTPTTPSGSCPYVSVFDGEQYTLQGELFTGAVKRKLERPDYLPLDIQPVNGAFQIRIHNELREKQYTDYADLVMIEHPDQIQAGIGTDGRIFTIAAPVLPSRARLNDHQDILGAVSQADQISCAFDDTRPVSAMHDATFDFPNANQGKTGKLILRLKNTYWLDYLHEKHNQGFGRKFDLWQRKLDHQPVDKMTQWIDDQDLPLGIAVKGANGWKEITRLNLLGPAVYRQVIIPVSFDDPSSTISIRLTSGFMFWEVDYAAMDFTTDQAVSTTALHPVSALNEKGVDVMSFLAQQDGKYLLQDAIGNYADVKYMFHKKPAPGNTFSFVLTTSGYYEPIREYTTEPDIAFVRKFREPGAMAQFSVDMYQAFLRDHAVTTAHGR